MRRIVKPRQFLLLILISFIGLSLLCIASYHLLVSKDIKISHSYKQFLLEYTDSPRLIIDSGSNSQHGINSIMLEKELGLLTINLSDNAGYPLKQKLLRIERYSSPGDIVLLPLEWQQYSYQNTSKIFLEFIFSRLNYYYTSLPLVHKIELIRETPFSTVVNAFLNKKTSSRGALLPKLIDEYVKLRNYEKRFKNSDRADYKYSGPLPIAKDATRTKTCTGYVFSNQLKYGFSVSDVFKDNIKIVKRLQKNGIKVFFTWPAVTGDNCYKGKEAVEFKKFVNEIKNYMRDNKITIISEPEDSDFPRKYMLNTYYHLIPDARDIRTKTLIKNIKHSKIIKEYKYNKTKPYTLAITASELKKNILSALDSVKNNQIIEFGKKDSRNNIFLISGWYPFEKSFVWSKGNKSTIFIKLDEGLISKSLVMHITSKIFGKKDKTEISINGKSIGSHMLHGENELIIPENMTKIKDGILKIEFHHINVKSPFEYGVSKDQRKLKLQLVSLKILVSEE